MCFSGKDISCVMLGKFPKEKSYDWHKNEMQPKAGYSHKCKNKGKRHYAL